MGNRIKKFKNGELISDVDTRTLEEVKAKRLKELNESLFKYLSKTDWQVIRAADFTSQKPQNSETLSMRQKARDKVAELERRINAAKDMYCDDLERLDPNVENHL